MGLPYFPLYVTDYEADTAHLTLEEDGVYMRLLRLCWRTPGYSIPNEPKWIARHMRVTWEDFERVVAPILSEFFKIEASRYYSPRLMDEAQKASVAHEKRKLAGSKGGSAKALKYNKTAPSNARAMLKQPEPEPELDIREAKASRRRSKTALPEGFIPDLQRFGAMKEEMDLSREEMNFCFQRMKDHAYATDRRQVDWNAALASWIRKSVNDGEIGPRSKARRAQGANATAFDF